MEILGVNAIQLTTIFHNFLTAVPLVIWTDSWTVVKPTTKCKAIQTIFSSVV